jgi:hypothetical protein
MSTSYKTPPCGCCEGEDHLVLAFAAKIINLVDATTKTPRDGTHALIVRADTHDNHPLSSMPMALQFDQPRSQPGIWFATHAATAGD